MGDGEDDADEPDNGRPLPPDDRIWRHPAEVAMDARRRLARRRARRFRAGATLVGGALVITGLVWISSSGPAEVALRADPIRLGSADDPAPPTSLAVTDERTPGPTTTTSELFSFREPADGTAILVRSAEGEALAGALMVRAGYIATSGEALGGVVDVVVTWGTSSEPGTVVGHDAVTDVSVIHVDGVAPGGDLADAPVSEGDEINMATEDGSRSTQRVVDAASTSAKANGDPVVGIVELDGRLGDVPPGSPAYDMNGDVVGIATATATDAPAAIIPIELARGVAEEIIDTGSATHPWLGVRARDLTDDDPTEREGSLITFVSTEGAAAEGGVLEGDLVTRIDHHEIDSMAAMVATLRSYEPGDVVEVIVWRDGSETSCTVELLSHADIDT